MKFLSTKMEESSFLEGLEVLPWKRKVGGDERLKMKSREKGEDCF